MIVQCVNCSKEFSITDDMVGQNVICPNCGEHVLIASADGRPRVQLRRQESDAPHKVCPSCGAEMGEGAIVCVHCGRGLTLAKLRSRSAQGGARRPLAAIAATVVIVLALAGGAAWYLRWPPFDRFLGAGARPTVARAKTPPVAAAATNAPAAETNRMMFKTFTLSAESPDKAWFRGNLADLILRIAGDYPAPLVIDPEIAGELARIAVTLDAAGAFTNPAAVAELLKPYGFTIRSVTLKPGTKIEALTTAATWTYGTAVWHLQQKDADEAARILKTAPAESSEFAGHCRDLGLALEQILALARDAGALRRRAKTEAEKCKTMRQSVAHRETATTASMTKDTAQKDYQAAQVLLARQMQIVTACWDDFNALVERAVAANPALVKRYHEARYTFGLAGEARYLLESLFALYGQLKDIEDLLQTTEVKNNKPALTPEPVELQNLLTGLQAWCDARDRYFNEALNYIGQNESKAYRSFSAAHALDRGALLARVGVGYGQTRLFAAGLRALHAARELCPPVADLEKEAARTGRRGFCRAARRLLSGAAGEDALPLARTGTVCALSTHVTDENGAIFSCMVQPADAPPLAAARRDVTRDYWGCGVWRELVDPPGENVRVAFGGYGAADYTVRMAAGEMWKWLATVDENRLLAAGRGMRVDCHDLLYRKPADSIGLAMAVGGCSIFRGASVRQETAVTGIVRADGGLQAVGGMACKVAGALGAPSGVEVLLVPAENEPDLALIPFDQLCRVTIVCVKDAGACLKYALTAESNPVDLGRVYAVRAPSGTTTQTLERVYEVWQDISEWPAGKMADHYALDLLQDAQVRLLIGDRDGAADLLRIVGQLNPDIYNARRLLEMMRLYRRPAAASGSTGG
jgi:DNA-directed RNA polymerase subunit RPC12/RpoP